MTVVVRNPFIFIAVLLLVILLGVTLTVIGIGRDASAFLCGVGALWAINCIRYKGRSILS